MIWIVKRKKCLQQANTEPEQETLQFRKIRFRCHQLAKQKKRLQPDTKNKSKRYKLNQSIS